MDIVGHGFTVGDMTRKERAGDNRWYWANDMRGDGNRRDSETGGEATRRGENMGRPQKPKDRTRLSDRNYRTT